ncbi:hypothetical protein [Novosphingobium sp. 9]|uniref:hypothetical protein n=1 Tax=Novosphingobium sp. 9 TaxID=2025349 RepID=UPI0021B4E4F4|nr:hypothetical protein [Novosphingobium sp. 9]
MSAPAELISIREFARRDGCDDKLVRRAVKSGKLRVSEDGRIDSALVGSDWRKTNRRAARSADTGPAKGADIQKVSAPNVRSVRTSRKVSAPAEEEVAEALESLTDEEADSFLIDVLAGRFRDTGDAEQIKENALAAKHLIAARKDAGDLVEVARAETIFFEAARSWRDIWLGFPTRVGPMLAADLDLETDKVVEALTVYVQKELEQLGTPEGNFAAEE